MELPVLNFPERYNIRVRKENSSWYIFDEVRKKWLILTPEEWVRQHIIFYLIKNKGVVNSALIIEKKLELNMQIKRLDILVMKKDVPLLLVECKAPEVALTQEVFEQSARYNIEIQAQYILLTNGLNHIYLSYRHQSNEYQIIDENEILF